MRTVQATDTGTVELSYMWMPTFLAMNTTLLNEIQKEVSASIVGQPLTEEKLDEVHDLVIELLEKKFPNIAGLRDYLDSLKYVYLANEERPAAHSD